MVVFKLKQAEVVVERLLVAQGGGGCVAGRWSSKSATRPQWSPPRTAVHAGQKGNAHRTTTLHFQLSNISHRIACP